MRAGIRVPDTGTGERLRACSYAGLRVIRRAPGGVLGRSRPGRAGSREATLEGRRRL